LHDVTLETVLDLLLNNVGGADNRIDYAVADGVIRISTREDLDRKTITRIYDCRELIGTPSREDLAAILAEHRQQPSTRPWGWVGAEVFGAHLAAERADH